MRFERLAAAFESNEVARVRLCESSGSEHSAGEESADLSDLVKSFMEKNSLKEDSVVNDNDDGELEWYDYSEKKKILQEIFGDFAYDNVKEKIRREVEVAYELVGGDKRLVMSRLRERGFDAGICKTRWERNRKFPSGDYEYIDVNYGGNRYIVEISLMAEFEIARPIHQYASLLDVFPFVFVAKVEDLKRLVRLMCTAIKDSMKTMEMHTPPWRRNSYMQAKWFNSYKRTTNQVPTTKSIGFQPYNCTHNFGSKFAF